MISSDIAGIALVYIYVAILLLITEKILDNHSTIGRKILHIMVGNIAFLLSIFQTREAMAFVAAAPFILITFLMSQYSPIKSIKSRTSTAGHGMGLLYCSISWTILSYLFFDHKEIIAIGILAMSYGDGFASLVGMKLGNRTYNIFGDEKSYLGSITMFIFAFVMSLIALNFYGISIYDKLPILAYIALVATVAEALSPKGLDNLSVPFIVPAIYWIFVFT